jgi:pimeloyl-ACP methyl ester carboxylesterase
MGQVPRGSLAACRSRKAETSAVREGVFRLVTGDERISRNRFIESGVVSFISGMMDLSPTIIFLPGSGGGSPDLSVFRMGPDDATHFEPIGYPDWRRSVAAGFSAEAVISDLVAQIVRKVPEGPIHIIGLSLGGHMGYAAALRLQAMGREIAGLCAIDSFMFASTPSAGWKGRAFVQGLELLRGRRFGEFMRFLRSKFWRGLVRLAGGRLSVLLRGFSSFGRLRLVSDPILEGELSMRLLVREVAPWIASLDREPVPLKAPAVLLRTRLTVGDDPVWLRRCPNIKICEIPGRHDTLFEAENVGSLREAFLTATLDWRRDIRR